MRLIPIVAAIALVAVACSTSESSSPASSPDAGAEVRSEGTAPVVDTPEGTQAVEVATLGIGFAVPDSYTTLDPTELGTTEYESDWFADLADGVGIPAEELTTALRSNLELFLFAPPGPDARSDNITVEATADGQIPTRDEIRQQLEPLGVDDAVITSGTVDGAEVVDAAYEDEEKGRAGYDVYVEHPGGLVVLSVSAADPATARDVGEQLVETLRIAG